MPFIVGGVKCNMCSVIPRIQSSSYNNPQISQKMKYAQYIRTQSKTISGGTTANNTTSN